MSRLILTLIAFIGCGTVVFVGRVFISLKMSVVGACFGIAVFPPVIAGAALQWAVLIGIGMKLAVGMVSREVAPISSAVVVIFHYNQF